MPVLQNELIVELRLLEFLVKQSKNAKEFANTVKWQFFNPDVTPLVVKNLPGKNVNERLESFWDKYNGSK